MNEHQLYFYLEENNGDLAMGKLVGNKLVISEKLDILNSKNGTEFSPFVDQEHRFIIFTRYNEGDLNQQGFFIIYNQEDQESPKWAEPIKIERLPYGWGARVSKDGKYFYYSDGNDIYCTLMKDLQLEI